MLHKGRLPLSLIIGNFLVDPNFQKFDQAQRDFINAQLRRESGAVISNAEFDNAEKQYFPQPGDRPEVIEQKNRNRQNAIAGLVESAGPLGSQFQGNAPQTQGTISDGATATNPQTGDKIIFQERAMGASTMTQLPPGFVLDQPSQSSPQMAYLQGFVLDAPPAAPSLKYCRNLAIRVRVRFQRVKLGALLV